MKSKLLLFIGFLTIIASPTLADDTDIYTTPDIDPGSRPLVMLQLDFRQNLNGSGCGNSGECDTLISEGHLSGKAAGRYSKFDVLRAILRKVLSTVSGVEVGFMLSHEDSGKGCAVPGPSGPAQAGCSNGGFVGVGFDNVNDPAHFNKLIKKLDSLPTPASNPTAHWYQPSETHFEFFRYLTGQSPVNAHNSGDDHTGSGADPDVDVLTSDIDIQAAGGGDYISPILSSCRSIFSINFSFLKIGDDDNSDALIGAAPAGGGMGFRPDSNATDKFEQVIDFLYNADLANGNFGSVPEYTGTQNVTSYFFVPNSAKLAGDILAAAGGTDSAFSLDASPNELVDTLSSIFKEILSTSATFVPAVLPINSYNRAEVVDHAYLALFQAQGDGKPTWTGNIKKLKIAGTADSLALVDALGASAVAPDGRIEQGALTFWTDAATLPAPDLDNGEVANRDGRAVARGGAGQQIPGFNSGNPGTANGPATRTLYYDSGASLAALNVDVVTSSALQANLGAATAGDAADLIAYARGLDIDDVDGDSVVLEARPWLMSDPLHSRPVVINYGARSGYSVDNPMIYLGVGTNDGVFHFIRSTNSDGSESGREEWGFMPRSVMGIVDTLRSNSKANAHPYGVDGAPTAYIDDANTNGTVDAGESVYVVFGLRRGGSSYYALDVGNPTSPSLLWTIDGSGDFAEMGLTFSTPRIAHLDYGSGVKPVVIFGGGYDTNKDTHALGTDDTVGNAIYIVDLESGSLVWKAIQGTGAGGADTFEHADLVDSIPSAVTSIDTNGDGAVDRLVVGDTGGNVWRADLLGNTPSDWTLSLLAALGRHDAVATDKSDDRRFFHRPDFVQSQDENGPFDAVILGSGDRADPLDKGGSPDNYLFMIKDRNISVGAGVDTGYMLAALADITDNCLQNDSCITDPNLTHGWRMALVSDDEKMLSTPLTLGGTIFATSYLPPGPPAADVCGLSEGSGKLYAISLQDGTATRQEDEDYDPNYDPEVPTTHGRSTDLNSPGIPPEVVPLAPDKILRPDLLIEDGLSKTRWKTFWYLRENMDL